MIKINKLVVVIFLFLAIVSIGVVASLNNSGNESVIQTENTLNTIMRLSIIPESPKIGDTIQLSALLTTDDNTPIANENVTFFLNGENIGEKTTNNDGIAEIDIETSSMTSGSYIVSADYYGTSKYNISTTYMTINILDNPDIVEPKIIASSKVITQESNPKTIAQETIPTTTTQTDSVISGVDKVEDCIDEKNIIQEPIQGTCSAEQNVCDDAPKNLSCRKEQKSYDCITGYNNKEVTTKKCKTKGYIFDNKLKFHTEGYACSITKEQNNKVMICDSIYDGNGDGICTSGETCMKYIISNGSFESYEKNSRDEFVPTDESFFLNKISEEDVQ